MTATPGALVRGRRVERADGGVYVCALSNGPAIFNLAGEIGDFVLGHALTGQPVLLAGLPSIDLAAFDRLIAQLLERRCPMVLTGLLAAQTAGRAGVEAARERRVGVPVYLRYAAEWPSIKEEHVWWHAAEALLLAAETLGPAHEVYALRAGERGLSLMLKHPHGATSLLGIGTGEGGAPASLLLLGDEGAVEAVPPQFQGLGVGRPDAGDGATLMRRALDSDVPAEMAGWLTAALPLLEHAAARERGVRLARWAVGALDAIRESLDTGRPAATGTVV